MHYEYGNIMLSSHHALHIGIGDPNAIGWGITLGYLAAAVLSFMRARQYAFAAANRHVLFWLLTSLFLFLLGLNKQLDLQTFFLESARQLTIDLGLYEYRRKIVIAFISLLFVWGLASQAWLYSVLHRFDRPEKIALFGLGVLFAFIGARAAYFQHIDLFAHNNALLARRIHWLMEVVGIVCIAIAACSQKKQAASESVNAKESDKMYLGEQQYLK